MRQMRDFRCAEGHTTEGYVHDEVETVTCSTCMRLAVRVFTAPHLKLDPISGDFITATDKFERQHLEQTRIDTKREADHGPDDNW